MRPPVRLSDTFRVKKNSSTPVTSDTTTEKGGPDRNRCDVTMRHKSEPQQHKDMSNHRFSINWTSGSKKNQFLTSLMPYTWKRDRVSLWKGVFLSFYVRFLVFRSYVPIRSVPFLPVTRCVLYLHSIISVSGPLLFLVPSEYLQIFLGIPDTSILPDTSAICHPQYNRSLIPKLQDLQNWHTIKKSKLFLGLCSLIISDLKLPTPH